MERLEPADTSDGSGGRPQTSRAASFMSSAASFRSDLGDADRWATSRWRHPLGIALLLVTVFLWTGSNFLASVGLTLPCTHHIATEGEDAERMLM
jgi:hypothetical protein